MSAPFNLVTPTDVDLTKVQILDYARTAPEFFFSHIPGARHIAKSLAWREVDGVPGMLPPTSLLDPEIQALGLDPLQPTLVYDGGNGLYAARLAWGLITLGFQNVSLLEGGLASWTAENKKVARGPASKSTPLPGTLKLSGNPKWYATLGDVENRPAGVILLDTRTRAEFTGKDRRSARAGRIPGSIHWEWKRALEEDELRFKSSAELIKEFENLGITTNTTVITYCQSGVRAAHTLYALRLAGVSHVRVYDGSWEEWGNLADKELELGEPV